MKYLLVLIFLFYIQGASSQISFQFPANSIGGILAVDSGKAVVNGTAFLAGKKNLIITCEHVLMGKYGNIFLSLSGKSHNISTVYVSEKYDFSVSRFTDTVSYNHWEFGDFKKIRPGDSVVYIGWNEHKKTYEVDLAVVSAIGTCNNEGSSVDFLEFEGVGIPGYSGGPVMDRNGKVIAMMREAWTKKGVKGGAEVLINRAFSIEPIKIMEESVDRFKL